MSSPNEDSDEDGFRAEIAWRLFAAAASVQLGLTGVDYTLKRYRQHGPLGEAWLGLADQAIAIMHRAGSTLTS